MLLIFWILFARWCSDKFVRSEYPWTEFGLSAIELNSSNRCSSSDIFPLVEFNSSLSSLTCCLVSTRRLSLSLILPLIQQLAAPFRSIAFLFQPAGNLVRLAFLLSGLNSPRFPRDAVGCLPTLDPTLLILRQHHWLAVYWQCSPFRSH